MKFIKGISLFLIYPLVMIGLGIYIGIAGKNFFYPGDNQVRDYSENIGMESREELPMKTTPVTDIVAAAEGVESHVISEEAIAYGVSRAVASTAESLNVDTEYVLWERDLLAGSVEETTYRMPTKYVGMTREQFVKSMNAYASSPPLAELERGFVDLEVVSFSRERVVVQMNYQFVQPGDGFYLAAYDNMVVVYLEDKQTIYIETDIRLENLPVEVQGSVIDMLWVDSEAELFGFLENYSS